MTPILQSCCLSSISKESPNNLPFADGALHRGAGLLANCTSQLNPDHRGQLLPTAHTAASACQLSPRLLLLLLVLLLTPPSPPAGTQQLPRSSRLLLLLLLVVPLLLRSLEGHFGALCVSLAVLAAGIIRCGVVHSPPRAIMNAAAQVTGCVGLKGSKEGSCDASSLQGDGERPTACVLSCQLLVVMTHNPTKATGCCRLR